ncbi:rab-GTPase-TBC domain-containing protein [Phascolomyces articulosus]|uniref:Rab-GTPase-TBC domain-containing protein n=1 Tax=Phascolomyces articulosus TaxID=60185 RepID=A0AAD5PGN0_9FUNG|nr:rab-GTPase-TBC domain-containing protein [Phascolomyces articulosus]
MQNNDNNSNNDDVNTNIISKTDCVLPSDTYMFTKRRRANSNNNNSSSQQNNNIGDDDDDNSDEGLFNKLEEENARLPPQDSTMFIIAQIQRQTAVLEKQHGQEMDSQTTTTITTTTTTNNNNNELKSQLSSVVHHKLMKHEEQQEYLAIWEAVIQDFDRVATMTPHLLSVKLRAGIPDSIRGLVWQAMCKSASLHLETVYGQLCREQSPHERIIKRDLTRTFPCIDMFKQENGAGQLAMRRILESYSLYDTEVGYCQGLAFLVGPLLLNMPEVQAFCVFVRLMETYEMRPMFTLNMAGLQLRLYQFTHLLNELLPDLAKHMNNHGVHAAMYASQWFLTLFAYVFPMSLIQRIYDIVFAEGAAETIMRVAIAMLRQSQDKILQESEFEDLLDYVTSRKLIEPYYDDAQVIHDATSLSSMITRAKMDALADQYYNNKKKCSDHNKQQQRFWKRKVKRSPSNGSQRSIDSTVSTSSVASSLRRTHSVGGASAAAMMASSNNGVKYVTLEHHEQEIQKLSWTLAQLNTKHQQTINQLVELKMDKQDVESERDALKMTIVELEKNKQQKQQQQKQSYALSISSSSCDSIGSSTMQVDFAFSDNNTLSPMSLASSTDEDAASSITTSNHIMMDEEEQEQLRAELVRLKVENFELQQQIEKLAHEHEDMHVRLDMVNDGQMALVEQLITTKADMDELMKEKKKKDMEWLEATRENAELKEQLTQLKAKASQLMLDHTRVVRRDIVTTMGNSGSSNNKSNHDVVTATATSSSITASTHQNTKERQQLVSKKNLQRRRSTDDTCTKQLILSESNNDSSSMADTFLVMRIRELEQSLAEAKIRLVEYEANQDQHQHDPPTSPLLVDKKRSASVDIRGVSRSGSIYGRVWHAITPRSSTTVDRSSS